MSRRIIVMVLVVGAVAGTASAGANASSNLPRQPKIIGGQPDPYNDTKWVAALHEKGFPGVECGGSLYSSRFVVTAAHCTRGTTAGQWTVRLGSKQWNTGGVVRSVTRIYRYPGYNASRISGDLSVLQLSQSVAIPPVHLVPSGEADIGSPAYIFGWGSTVDIAHGYPSTRQETWVWVRPDSTCHNYYGGVYDPNTEICASRSGHATCDGDSGGPLAVWTGSQWLLLGATSYGARSSCRVGPDVFAWIGSPPLHRWLTGS